MERDRDEKIIQSVFEGINIPKIDMVQAVHYRLSHKPRKSFKKSIGVALIAIIVLTTSVVAVASAVGSFERLGQIVGEDNAARLIPVGGENTSEVFYTENGMKIKVVAIGLGYNVVDVYIKIEDLLASRLHGEIVVESSVGRNGEESIAFTNPQIIDRSEGGVITLHSRNWFSSAGELENITVTIHQIHYGGANYFWWNCEILNRLRWGGPLGIDISALQQEPESLFITAVYNTGFNPDNNTHYISDARSPLLGWRSMDRLGNMPSFADISWQEGTYIIAPGQTNYEIDMDSRIRSSISSVGVVDGTLRVLRQYKPMPVPSEGQFASILNRTELFLHREYAGYERNVFPTERTEFILDENGAIIQGLPFRAMYAWQMAGIGGVNYVEYRFPVDVSRLEEYRLAGIFSVYDQVMVDWSMVIDITEGDHPYLVAQGLYIPVGDGAIFTVARVHNWGIIFEGTYNCWDWAEEYLRSHSWQSYGSNATLNTSDGPIQLRFPWIRSNLDELGFRAEDGKIYIAFISDGNTQKFTLLDIDIDTVLSIDLNGQTIYLR